MQRVAVIGAGVNGLGCAVRIKEKFPSWEIIIISKDFSPNTTGDGSAGLWSPYLIGDTPREKVLLWGDDTYQLFFSLWREGIAGSCLVPCLRLNKEKTDAPAWKETVFGYRDLSGDDFDFWRKTLSLDFNSAQEFLTFTCEPPLLLKYLTDRFLNLGGKFKLQEVTSIEDILNENYDIVINCTGLGAKYVVPDNSMYPIRGQISRVKTPWIYHCILDDSDDGNYIIPNTSTCVLGGTHQINDSNKSVDSNDSKFIKEGCSHMFPGLMKQQHIYEWVGLRPGRDCVRLEIEKKYNDRTRKRQIVIHNYGHGGSGVTLFWGCAAEVVNMLVLNVGQNHNTNSKL